MAEYPWKSSKLEGWDIVGMNHYYVNGSRRIFIAMVKEDKCIKVEGADTAGLWEELEFKAKWI